VSDLAAALEKAFGADRVKRGEPLAPFTTFKVGGPADILLETQSSDEIVQASKLAHAAAVKVTMLGGGSNVLIADNGIRGLVIRPRGGEVTPVGDRLVRADAAVTINGLVRWTINRGYAGLEAWAGTPGTVGGAIYGNAHWKKINIGDLIESVRLIRPDGTLLQAPADRMEFDYDYSRLKKTGEIVLWAAFRVTPGGGIPTSAGALVDRAGLKGAQLGGARVSPTHANFIVNDGSAKAGEIFRLVERCRNAVKDQFGVVLRNEIICLGNFESRD